MLQPTQKQELIKDFKKIILDLYGDRLAKIVLYGSYARGDFHEESDIDFLVVLKDKKLKRLTEILRMSKVIHPLILKHNVEISYHPMPFSQFQSQRSPFLFWIRKDGVEV